MDLEKLSPLILELGNLRQGDHHGLEASTSHRVRLYLEYKPYLGNYVDFCQWDILCVKGTRHTIMFLSHVLSQGHAPSPSHWSDVHKLGPHVSTTVLILQPSKLKRDAVRMPFASDGFSALVLLTPRMAESHMLRGSRTDSILHCAL